MQDSDDGCVRLPAEMFPEGVLNPVPRNTHSFGGFPSLSDKGSSGFMGLNSLRNPSGRAWPPPPACCLLLACSVTTLTHHRQLKGQPRPDQQGIISLSSLHKSPWLPCLCDWSPKYHIWAWF